MGRGGLIAPDRPSSPRARQEARKTSTVGFEKSPAPVNKRDGVNGRRRLVARAPTRERCAVGPRRGDRRNMVLGQELRRRHPMKVKGDGARVRT
jgi:hypothetical protein